MGSQAWNEKNTVLIALRFTVRSGIPDALKRMTEQTGEKDTVYIRRILLDRLKKDGFLTEEK